MSSRSSQQMAASVRRRLLTLSKARREDYNLILVQYGIERFLYRLSQSEHASQFVLKGATLFAVWEGEMHRPTRDLDLLKYGAGNDQILVDVFSQICATSVAEDGIRFDSSTIEISDIRGVQEYGGKRISLTAYLASARILMKIDVGFGDVVTPYAEYQPYPTLLNFPEPALRMYTKETVIAEKFHAMVTLGMLNSRLKDYYDLWILSRRSQFDSSVMIAALEATLSRRNTDISSIEEPIGLSFEFSEDTQKQIQWNAFIKRGKLDVENLVLGDIVSELRAFLLPIWQAVRTKQAFQQTWTDGAWR